MVKRAGPDPARLLADQRFQPPNHLPGRASGERDQHDRSGRHARGDQVGDAIGDDPRLARARPGQDQVVAVGRRHRRPLRVVQLALKLLGQPGVQGRFEANLPHATAPAGSKPWTFRSTDEVSLYHGVWRFAGTESPRQKEIRNCR